MFYTRMENMVEEISQRGNFFSTIGECGSDFPPLGKPIQHLEGEVSMYYTNLGWLRNRWKRRYLIVLNDKLEVYANKENCENRQSVRDSISIVKAKIYEQDLRDPPRGYRVNSSCCIELPEFKLIIVAQDVRSWVDGLRTAKYMWLRMWQKSLYEDRVRSLQLKNPRDRANTSSDSFGVDVVRYEGTISRTIVDRNAKAEELLRELLGSHPLEGRAGGLVELWAVNLNGNAFRVDEDASIFNMIERKHRFFALEHGYKVMVIFFPDGSFEAHPVFRFASVTDILRMVVIQTKLALLGIINPGLYYRNYGGPDELFANDEKPLDRVYEKETGSRKESETQGKFLIKVRGAPRKRSCETEDRDTRSVQMARQRGALKDDDLKREAALASVRNLRKQGQSGVEGKKQCEGLVTGISRDIGVLQQRRQRDDLPSEGSGSDYTSLVGEAKNPTSEVRGGVATDDFENSNSPPDASLFSMEMPNQINECKSDFDARFPPSSAYPEITLEFSMSSFDNVVTKLSTSMDESSTSFNDQIGIQQLSCEDSEQNAVPPTFSVVSIAEGPEERPAEEVASQIGSVEEQNATPAMSLETGVILEVGGENTNPEKGVSGENTIAAEDDHCRSGEEDERKLVQEPDEGNQREPTLSDSLALTGTLTSSESGEIVMSSQENVSAKTAASKAPEMLENNVGRKRMGMTRALSEIVIRRRTCSESSEEEGVIEDFMRSYGCSPEDDNNNSDNVEKVTFVSSEKKNVNGQEEGQETAGDLSSVGSVNASKTMSKSDMGEENKLTNCTSVDCKEELQGAAESREGSTPSEKAKKGDRRHRIRWPSNAPPCGKCESLKRDLKDIPFPVIRAAVLDRVRSLCTKPNDPPGERKSFDYVCLSGVHLINTNGEWSITDEDVSFADEGAATSSSKINFAGEVAVKIKKYRFGRYVCMFYPCEGGRLKGKWQVKTTLDAGADAEMDSDSNSLEGTESEADTTSRLSEEIYTESIEAETHDRTSSVNYNAYIEISQGTNKDSSSSCVTECKVEDRKTPEYVINTLRTIPGKLQEVFNPTPEIFRRISFQRANDHFMSIDLTQLREELMPPMKEALKQIHAHFAAALTLEGLSVLGDDHKAPSIGMIIRDNFCKALAAILGVGFRGRGLSLQFLFGRPLPMNLWSLFRAVGQTIDNPDMQRIFDSVSSSKFAQEDEGKFRLVVTQLLSCDNVEQNEKLLMTWFRKFRISDQIIQKFYLPGTLWCSQSSLKVCQLIEELMTQVESACHFSYQLHPDFEVFFMRILSKQRGSDPFVLERETVDGEEEVFCFE